MLQVVRRLHAILKRVYPNLQVVFCGGFGVRYVYYTDETLLIKIGEGHYLTDTDSTQAVNKAMSKVFHFYQTDSVVKWVKFNGNKRTSSRKA